MTFIPVMAIRFDNPTEAERYLLARSGYGRAPETQASYLFLCKIDGDGPTGHYDPYSWGAARTMGVAHLYLLKCFDELESGAVVDVEFILSETPAPKVSEREMVAAHA